MAKSNYEAFAEIFGADEVGRILEADRPVKCNTCAEEEIATAHRNLAALATWWMADVGRRWAHVRTRITVNRRADGAGSEAWFGIEVPRWNKPIRIFLAIVQHTLSSSSPRRKHLHYQLQVPCAKELNADTSRSGYEARVKDLGDKLRQRLQDLQEDSRVSIPLNAATEQARGRIEKDIAALVETLGRWEWGAL